MKKYTISGMSCAACQSRVEKAVNALPNVDSAVVSLLTNSMQVEGSASDSEIIQAVEKAGYGAKTSGGSKKDTASMEEDQLKDTQTPILRKRLIVSLVLLIPLMYISMGLAFTGVFNWQPHRNGINSNAFYYCYSCN